MRHLEQPINPNHRLHVDLYGPLQTSENGKKFVVVMTDAYSKYVELATICKKSAKEVARAVIDTWITRYSTPREIVTDNGKEFCNKTFEKELCQQLGILHKTTTPYHPECNGQAECFNRTMTRYLRAAIQPPYLDWESYLPALRISYNTSVSKATQMTPFSLVFGMPARMPIFAWELDKSLNYDEDALTALEALKHARKVARENNIQYRREYEVQHNKKHRVKDSDIIPEDWVWISFPPKQKFKNPKLQPLFVGPFKVIKVNDTTVYYEDGNTICRTHLNRCKRAYFEEEAPSGKSGAKSRAQPARQDTRHTEEDEQEREVEQGIEFSWEEVQPETADPPIPPDTPWPPTPAAVRPKPRQAREPTLLTYREEQEEESSAESEDSFFDILADPADEETEQNGSKLGKISPGSQNSSGAGALPELEQALAEAMKEDKPQEELSVMDWQATQPEPREQREPNKRKEISPARGEGRAEESFRLPTAKRPARLADTLLGPTTRSRGPAPESAWVQEHTLERKKYSKRVGNQSEPTVASDPSSQPPPSSSKS